MKERMKILVAYDGSDCADDTLIDLRRAGLPPEADALVINVEEVWLPVPVGLQNQPIKSAAQAAGVQPAFQTVEPATVNLNETQVKTLSAAERLRSFFPEWNVKTEFLQGSPATTLIQRAKEWNAGLIVTGSHGRSGYSRFWLGSVSQKIANEAGCSVRVARGHGNWKSGSPARILIGLDGTDASFSAAEEVANRFWMIGSEVRLVVALDKSDLIMSMQNSLASIGKSELEDDITPVLWISNFVERVRRRLSRAELQVSELIEEGDPKQIVVAEAEEWGADCIFIGAGESRNDRVNSLLGSVSTAILSRAHCTVEIVRHASQ